MRLKKETSSRFQKYLKDIAYFENYTTDGPAFKVGAGVQAREIYNAAFEKALMAVGGVCDVWNLILFIRNRERKVV